MKKWLEKHPRSAYLIGYVLSLVLTVNTFVIVSDPYVEKSTSLIVLLALLAVLQVVAQLVFFLHLGQEEKPRWNSMAFWTMSMVVLFIVIGSIWVMNNLDYNMMSHDTVETMVHDEGISHE